MAVVIVDAAMLCALALLGDCLVAGVDGSGNDLNDMGGKRISRERLADF